MVLLWTLLISIVSNALYFSIADTLPPVVDNNWLLSFPLVVALVAAPLSGWLADAKFGNYKVLRFGAVLLFISTVINCLLLILEALVWENSTILKWIHTCSVGSLFVVAFCVCIVPALPLGLDQMPDASASSITSYIAWFVGTIFVANFLGIGIHRLFNCLNKTMQSSYYLIWALLLTICMSVVFSSNWFIPRWLIIEPKSPQSLKAIFQVLKFAAKHKAPLNRSALTYWEEDIPSRMDLGKMKYGGPFTTEQVEDVKTILRLIAITVSFCFVGLFFFFPIATDISVPIYIHVGSTRCDSSFLLNSFAGYGLLGTLAYEFLVYPLVRNKLPSILKRIGVASLLTITISFVCFILKLAHFLSYSSETTTEWIFYIIYYSTSGLLGQVLLTLVLEFMCAQSPYNMRGLLISLVVPLVIASATIGTALGTFLNNKIDSICTQSWCSFILISVRIVFCLVGFLLFCVVAHWYKKRVRDEDYSPQRVVEEVYDRYLTAEAAQSSKYGITN